MNGITDEYRIIASGAGLIDLGARGRLLLDGRDTSSFLHALVSNDVEALKPGDGVYATYLTPQGRMISDLEIYRLSDSFLVDVPPDRLASLAERLEAAIFAEDVRVGDASAAIAEFGVIGAQAGPLLAAAMALETEALAGLGLLQHVNSPDGFIARSGDALLPTFKIFVPTERKEAVRRRVAAQGIAPMSATLAEALRIEAGRPRFGVDMTEDTIPLEAGLLERGISTTKGCYVGQEIVVRILHRGTGQPARRLVRLSLEGAADRVTSGARLLNGDREVGRLTSVAVSPTTSRPIALGYVPRDLAEVGTQVTVGGAEGVTATIAGLAG